MDEITDDCDNLNGEIATDYIGCVLGINTSKFTVAKCIETLRIFEAETEEEHGALLVPLNAGDTQFFSQYVEAMFEDGIITWERIARLFVLAGKMAMHFKQANRLEEALTVDQSLGLFVKRRLGKWIEDHGGWEAFNEHFTERSCFSPHVAFNEHFTDVTCATTTVELVKDIIAFKLGKARPTNTISLTARTLRRIAGDVECVHADLFQNMLRTVASDKMNIFLSFSQIQETMFADNVVNWGRIAVLFTFAANVASFCERNGMIEGTDVIVQYLTTFVNSRLLKWIEKTGGWEAFNEHFKEKKANNGVCWTDLICTVGIVAGAAGAALVLAR